MENLGDEYSNYWETTMFFQNQELECNSWGLEEVISGSGEARSPDGVEMSPASKNVTSERKRRQRLNERLFALRSLVPNISKLDKASVIKDSIAYIEELCEQEKRLEAEIREFESISCRNPKNGYNDYDQDEGQYCHFALGSQKIKQRGCSLVKSRTAHCPIEVLEMKVTCMGEKIAVVCITCSKKEGTMVRLCEVFESLNFKIITVNISSFSGRLSTTLILQVNEEEKDVIERKIQSAITESNDPYSFMSIF